MKSWVQLPVPLPKRKEDFPLKCQIEEHLHFTKMSLGNFNIFVSFSENSNIDISRNLYENFVLQVYEHVYETVDISSSPEVRANATAKVSKVGLQNAELAHGLGDSLVGKVLFIQAIGHQYRSPTSK